SKKYPSWSKIEKDRSGEIKYDLGFYILEFIDNKYGWDKILALIISNGDIESTLRMEHKQFEHEFYAYLEERYSG
ncbi:MAG: hypothetical protein AAGG59_09125, partial [Bacteroidota bacterium]